MVRVKRKGGVYYDIIKEVGGTVNIIVIISLLAERVGFEPTRLSSNGFQDRLLKPLGHLSMAPHRGLEPLYEV